MSTEPTYVEKNQKNETADLWREQLGHVGYDKLNPMMKRSA